MDQEKVNSSQCLKEEVCVCVCACVCVLEIEIADLVLSDRGLALTFKDVLSSVTCTRNNKFIFKKGTSSEACEPPPALTHPAGPNSSSGLVIS